MAEKVNIKSKKPIGKRENSLSKTRKDEFSQASRSPVENMLDLQRTIGNQAVQGMLKTGKIQAKFKIGQPNDKYEQEADRIAHRVMRMPEPICPECLKEEEDDKFLQLKSKTGQSPGITSSEESNIKFMKCSGQPLSKAVRNYFEPRFGADFSQVRVHSSDRAAEAAQRVNARAFTLGSDVVFGPGQFAPETTKGKSLLAHELAHVVQQNQVSELNNKRLNIPDSPYINKESNIIQQSKSGTESVGGFAESLSKSNNTTLQRQPSTGSMYLRVKSDGSIETMYGTPTESGAPSLGFGARCKGGRCVIVGSGDPADLRKTYSVAEALKRLREIFIKRYSPWQCPPGRQMSGVGCCKEGEMWLPDKGCVKFKLSGLPSQKGQSSGLPSLLPPAPFTPKPLQLGKTRSCEPFEIAVSEGSAVIDSFAFEGDKVPGNYIPRLKQLAAKINKLLQCHPYGEVQVTGHTDAIGGDAFNERLGQKRADAVKTILADEGVSKDIIFTKSAGKSQLLVKTQKREPRNRRVEILFIPKSHFLETMEKMKSKSMRQRLKL